LKGFVTIKWQVVDFFKDLFIGHGESSQLQDQFWFFIFSTNQSKLPNKANALINGAWMLMNRKRKKE